MNSYFEEVKKIFNFVARNFNHYKKSEVRKKPQAVMPKRNAKARVGEKVKVNRRKRKLEIAPIRRVN